MRTHKNTGLAKRRMAQLRRRKLYLEKHEAILEWSARTGRASSEWWKAAQAAGLTHDSTVQERIAFLRETTR
jgi:hypothetical protein